MNRLEIGGVDALADEDGAEGAAGADERDGGDAVGRRRQIDDAVDAGVRGRVGIERDADGGEGREVGAARDAPSDCRSGTRRRRRGRCRR